MKRFLKYYREKKGMSLVWMTLLLFVLLVFAATAIDIVYMYHTKNQLQLATDAAVLAGVMYIDSAIDDSADALEQVNARREAWKFACLNKAPGIESDDDFDRKSKKVFLVTKDEEDCNNEESYEASDLNGGNNKDGDIVVGNWDPNRTEICLSASEDGEDSYVAFCRANGSTGLSINAIKAVARRTFDDPEEYVSIGNNPVRLFLGKVFQVLGGGNWQFMNAKADAIASYRPAATAGITLCIDACPEDNPGIVLPATFEFNQQEEGSPFGAAWTEFNLEPNIEGQSCLQNPNPGGCDTLQDDCGDADGELIAAYIWHRKIAPPICQPITWDNGLKAARYDLYCAFSSTVFDADKKTYTDEGDVDTWTLLVPVTNECPSGKTPGQGPYEIIKFAEVELDEITGANYAQLIIKSIRCIACDELPGLNKPKLVE